MLFDFFTGVDGLNVPSGSFVADPTLAQLADMPVDNIFLSDQGDRAAARILAAIPGSDVTVDADGRVRVYSPFSGAEQAVVGTGKIGAHGRMGPEIKGGGHIEIITNEFVAPEAVDCYFVIEQEVRFNFKSGGASQGATVAEEDVDFILENVAPIPDFDLTVQGQRQFFGTFLPIERLLEAWLGGLPPDALITNITAATLDKAMVPGVDLWGALDLLGSLDATPERTNWSARFAALRQHYLRTFRIHSEWMDRFLQIHAYLVGTIDVVSGQRAPAKAFSNHAVLPSRKALILASRETEDRVFASNVDGYPGDEAELTDSIRPAPAEVSILDDDQGILKIDYQIDPWGFGDVVLPAKILDDPAGGTRPVKFSMRKSDSHYPPASNAIAFTGGAIAKLDPVKRTAVIFTAVPAAPNSKRQYYRIRISPKDVAGILPAAALASAKKAKGPVKQVFIGPGIETARSRWKQSEKETIKRVFGMGGSLDDVPASSQNPDGSIKAGAPTSYRDLLKSLVVNDDDQSNIPAGLNAASLPAIARAAASSIWTQHAERAQGSITGAMQNLRIDGQIREIRAYIDGAGASLIQANLPEEIEPLPFFSFMDASTRRLVMKVPV
jgi:hypothetical protein